MSKSKTIKRVAYILDKSGSMSICRQQVVDGTNDYLAALAEQDPDTRITITMFDTQVKEVCRDIPVREIPPLTKQSYCPDGGTALYDAVASAIMALEETASEDQECLCVIFTDGEENSSVEITGYELSHMIESREKTGRWTFTYLGANQDSWASAAKMGIAAGNAIDYSVGATRESFARVGRLQAQFLSARAERRPVREQSMFGNRRHVDDFGDDDADISKGWMAEPDGEAKD